MLLTCFLQKFVTNYESSYNQKGILVTIPSWNYEVW